MQVNGKRDTPGALPPAKSARWQKLYVLMETEWEGVGWVDLAQDGDRWRALVNKVMNLRVP
jgi:hypothetical protein